MGGFEPFWHNRESYKLLWSEVSSNYTKFAPLRYHSVGNKGHHWSYIAMARATRSLRESMARATRSLRESESLMCLSRDHRSVFCNCQVSSCARRKSCMLSKAQSRIVLHDFYQNRITGASCCQRDSLLQTKISINVLCKSCFVTISFHDYKLSKLP